MKDICNVTLSPQALKDLKKVPLHIAIKLQAWIDDVGHRGLMAARKIPGYHDEPLKGKRQSQRSIRLSRAYRAITPLMNIKISNVSKSLRSTSMTIKSTMTQRSLKALEKITGAQLRLGHLL